MLPKFTIVAPNIAKAAKVIGDGSRKWSDWRPAWQQLLPFLVEGLEENIRSGGSSLGKRFPELATSTLAVRERLGLGSDLLIGRTRELVSQAGAKKKITRSRLKVGPPAGERYPFVQHFGSRGAGRSRKTIIPARQFIGFSQAMRTVALSVMNAHAKAQLRELADELRDLG